MVRLNVKYDEEQMAFLPPASLRTSSGSCPYHLERSNPEQGAGTGNPLEGDSVRGLESELSLSNSTDSDQRNPKIGDCMAVWDYEASFTELHKTPTQLAPLRRVGDPLADECVAALGVKPGEDAFEILAQYLSRPLCEQESDAPRKFLDSVVKVPDWVDWDIIRQGHQMHWNYANAIIFALCHYSLVGGFGNPKLVRTLRCTNYLTSPPGRSYQRLMETVVMINDCMNDGIQRLQPRTGKGWTSVVRVRLLHSQVRLRILKLAESCPGYFSVAEDGVPVNQEDLVGILCGFSIALILALQKIGIHPSPKEISAYLHLWRLIGHYLGIHDENNPLTSREEALRSFESIVSHLNQPDDLCAEMANSILRAVADRPPLNQSFAFHSAGSRALLGDNFSNVLRIQRSSLYDRVMVKLFFAFLRWPPYPWWTKAVQKVHNWFIRRTATKMEMNFNMKLVPQVPEKDVNIYN